MKVTLDLSVRELKSLTTACKIRVQDLLDRVAFHNADNNITNMIMEELGTIMDVEGQLVRTIATIKEE